jgi:Xaa-Pro aminopeptidase
VTRATAENTDVYSARLAAVRAQLAGLAAFIVPRADEHLGEYVASNSERLAWLTGFTGSAGLAVVTSDRAAVFTDGRYSIQLDAQVDPGLWEGLHILKTPPPDWLAKAVPSGRVGYDPWLISEDGLKPFLAAGLAMVPVEQNLVDAAWADRPEPPSAKVVVHPLEFAGKSAAEKRHEVAASLAKAGNDAAAITDPASVAWLLNIRGDDVPFTPFALGFVLLHRDGRADLFMDPAKIPPGTRPALGNEVSVKDRSELPVELAALAGKRVHVDGRGSPAWFAQTLRAAGATVIDSIDPCLVPKACKNSVEQAGARNAHIRDGVAISKFLHFLSIEGPAGTQTEMSAAARLVAFRAESPEFLGESFPAISSAGEHAAINHYRVTPETNRPIHPNEIYLVDSGAQYRDCTTDITRTIWTGPDASPPMLREEYTRVLKGLIAVDTLVFPEGSAGVHLDGFARRSLWEVGLDYDHGTGHGVGSYLAVHEGPASISRPLRPDALAAGMLMSIEPGYYVSGSHGIRLENLAFVQPADVPAAIKPFLRFENVTFAPFARNLIERSLLSATELGWVDAYHRQVLDLIGPRLEGAVREWLSCACARME